MRNLNRLAVVAAFSVATASAFAFGVDSIDPPYWWAGMNFSCKVDAENNVETDRYTEIVPVEAKYRDVVSGEDIVLIPSKRCRGVFRSA